MQQYEVPQFVDVEDKIIGPMTMKQFITFLGGIFFLFILWLIFGLSIFFWILAVPVAALTVLLSFGSFNGITMLASVLPLAGFIFRPKRRIFNREVPSVNIPQIKVAAPEVKPEETQPQDVHSRLKRLAYVLDQKNEEEEHILDTNTRMNSNNTN